MNNTNDTLTPFKTISPTQLPTIKQHKHFTSQISITPKDLINKPNQSLNTIDFQQPCPSLTPQPSTDSPQASLPQFNFPILTCSTHIKQKLNLYCVTCMKEVCKICKKISHPSHTPFESISTLEQQIKSTYYQLQDSINEQIYQLDTALIRAQQIHSTIDSSIQNITNKLLDVKMEIDDIFTQNIHSLNSSKKEAHTLYNQITSNIKNKQQIINKANDSLRELVQGINVSAIKRDIQDLLDRKKFLLQFSFKKHLGSEANSELISLQQKSKGFDQIIFKVKSKIFKKLDSKITFLSLLKESKLQEISDPAQMELKISPLVKEIEQKLGNYLYSFNPKLDRECKSVINYKNGNIYSGQWNLWKFDGYGISILADGTKYEGFWKDGKPHIKGREILSNGNYYEGDYLNGFFHGFGSYHWNYGESYEGYYKKGKKNGFGVYICNDGKKYIGNWKNDMKEGEGILHYINGDIFIGKFHKDLSSGIGKYIKLNGEVFQGEWKKDKLVRKIKC